LKCAILIPDVKDYPKNVLEVIAPENLRAQLKVKDGDEIAVTVTQ
jgi:CTP-dependent riboflavin kinase